MKRFENKTVLITGGTSGIGAATALAFAKEGANVVVGGRREAEGLKVVSEIEALGAKGLFVATDVTSEAAITGFVSQAVETFGSVDVAFNNAGTEGNSQPVLDESEGNYRSVFDVNVLGVLLSMKSEISQFKKQGTGGVIINTSSIAGEVGMPGASVYIASKHAVHGLTKSAAQEVAADGIRVLGISPAVIETEMFERFSGGDADTQAYMKSLHPIGRFGSVEEVANVVLFLASNDASFMTGSLIPVDGGFLAK